MENLEMLRIVNDMVARGTESVSRMALCSAIKVPTISAAHLVGILEGNITLDDLWDSEQFNYLFNVLVDDLMAIFDMDDYTVADQLNKAVTEALQARFRASTLQDMGIKVPSYLFLDPDNIYTVSTEGTTVTDFVNTYYYSEYGNVVRNLIPEGAVKDMATHAYENQGVLCLAVLSSEGGVLMGNLNTMPISGLPVLVSYNMRKGAFKYAIGVGSHVLPEMTRQMLAEVIDLGPVGIGGTTNASEWAW